MKHEERTKLLNTCNKVLIFDGAAVKDPKFYSEVQRVIYDYMALENDYKALKERFEQAERKWNEAKATIERMKETAEPPFTVIDKTTGEYPDLWKIALEEDWAKRLMYCDMEGFAIEEDGTLILLDECGQHAYCPEGRFEIVHRKDGEQK